MKKSLTMLFMTVIAAAFLFCGMTTPAQANPPYVKWKWVGYTIQVNNNFPPNDFRHISFKVVIQYTNTSDDKIVTALFKKAIQVNGVGGGGATFSASATSNKVNKVELYPGQSIKLQYFLTVNKLYHTNAYYRDRPRQDMIYYFIKNKKNMKSRMSHTFGASAKPI